MRSIPLAIGGAAGYYQRNAITRRGYGLRLSPNIDPAIVGDYMPETARIFPGNFPVKAVIRRTGKPESILWLRNKEFVSIPDGFDEVDFEVPSPEAVGNSNIMKAVPGVGSPLNVSYQCDIAERIGERIEIGDVSSKGVVQLNYGAIPIDSADGPPGTPEMDILNVERLYGYGDSTGFFYYIFPMYTGLKIVLSSLVDTSIVRLWQSTFPFSGNGSFELSENLDPSNWIPIPATAGAGYRMVLNRDCEYANEWIAFTSSDVNVTIHYASATYEN